MSESFQTQSLINRQFQHGWLEPVYPKIILSWQACKFTWCLCFKCSLLALRPSQSGLDSSESKLYGSLLRSIRMIYCQEY